MGGKSSKKSSEVKLTYFDIRGRGELIRLVMAAAKKELNDVRLDFAAWAEMKPKSTFGVLPVMEINGNEYCQSNAIATYLARVNDLYGSNHLENLMIDQILGLRMDIMTEEVKTTMGSDADKEAAAKKLTDDVYPRIFKLFSKFIEKNSEDSDYVVGEKLSVADLAIHEASQTCSQTNPELLDQYPEIKTLRETVAGEEGVKQYLEKRKVTPM